MNRDWKENSIFLRIQAELFLRQQNKDRNADEDKLRIARDRYKKGELSENAPKGGL